MIEVQKIACINSAAFVMSFQARTGGGSTDGSGNYPVGQTHVIDLANTPFKEELEFWPEVQAVLGKTQSANEHVKYKENGQTATYQVRGTTLDYSVELIG